MKLDWQGQTILVLTIIILAAMLLLLLFASDASAAEIKVEKAVSPASFEQKLDEFIRLLCEEERFMYYDKHQRECYMGEPYGGPTPPSPSSNQLPPPSG